MIRNTYRALVVLLGASFSICAGANDKPDGAALFVENCGSCHGQSQSADDRIAPPMVAVKDHYLRVHADKASFVNALSGWVLERSADTSLMPGAISRFGLMPPLAITDQDLAAIAEFVFEEPMGKPGWYAQHYLEHHGADGDQTQ